MEKCNKCGSKWVLISRTGNNEIISISCTSCGATIVYDKKIFNKINENYEKFKQEIQETQQCVGGECFA